VVFLLALILGVGRARGEDSGATDSLSRDVLPLFRGHCVKCHGPNKPKGKLDLSRQGSIARGGLSGPIVVPGNLEDSLLWDMVSNDEMPPEPEPRLSATEKETVRRWIERGAEGLPRGGAATAHWAFASPGRPTPPAVRDGARMCNPVDCFVQRALEERGLALGPDADRATAIRRLSFDLIGLPPSPAEIERFVHDRRSDAYDRLVDRLLGSPCYGERWGKHWLDAAGYADSNGYFSADSDRPLAWRYRDYIIRAFNCDRPLDQIVREQLAGDELASGHQGPDVPRDVVEQLVATHFLRNSQDGTGESDGNPDEVRADKYAVLEGTVQVIGSSLLGLTLQCAKCHDHKFEPVTQRDYYQLEAILYPAFNIEHWVKPNDRILVAGRRAELSPWQASDRMITAEIAALKRVFAAGPDAAKKITDETLNPVIESIEARRRPNPGRIAAVYDTSTEPGEIPILIRGNPATPGPKVGPGVPGFLSDPSNGYKPTPRPSGPWSASGSTTTSRRAAFARWLTRPGSRPAALLARVLVNRIWQHHFGIGLAATPENLGYTGSPPAHPELLEFLAVELARSGWSAKALHRLIVTSTVYRQSSASPPLSQARRVDPADRRLDHYPLRRLDAEQIRDAMLAASGELDSRQGGPYVATDRNQSGEVIVDESHQGATRRSIYLQQRRTQIESLLDVFDAPSIVTTCTRRLPSTVPLQSLTLLNSGFVAARAKRLAERLERDCPASAPVSGASSSLRLKDADADARVARAFVLVAGREASRQERGASRRFLDAQPGRYPGLAAADARKAAWVDFCQMLLASNAFLYLE
jgi:hypothetical protein